MAIKKNPERIISFPIQGREQEYKESESQGTKDPPVIGIRHLSDLILKPKSRPDEINRASAAENT
jgi:hypothetical protein